jgi:nucleoside-diphosphate-sugar epimerase
MGRAPDAMKVLVTGGGGFLGGAVCRLLLERGDRVRSFSRGRYPELEAAGVETFRGDLCDLDALRKAARGCDAVVHAAAKAGLWGAHEEYVRANVEGTRSVVEACRAESVGRLVHTSSPSVVFGAEGQEGVDESAPYPERFLASYPETKAEAERLALAANAEGLAVAALRPHLIWGPGDNHIVPRLVSRRKAGQLRRVGSGNPLVDSVYVDNAARAHLLALDRLPGVGGRVYFISNGEPTPLWDLVDGILGAAGLPRVEGSVPAGAAYAAGAALEGVYRLFGIRSEPRMTRFLAKELSTPHWFDMGIFRKYRSRRGFCGCARVSLEVSPRYN